jgi:hypothetical protein
MEESFQNVREKAPPRKSHDKSAPSVLDLRDSRTRFGSAPFAPSVLWQTINASSSSEKLHVIGPFA